MPLQLHFTDALYLHKDDISRDFMKTTDLTYKYSIWLRGMQQGIVGNLHFHQCSCFDATKKLKFKLLVTMLNFPNLK